MFGYYFLILTLALTILLSVAEPPQYRWRNGFDLGGNSPPRGGFHPNRPRQPPTQQDDGDLVPPSRPHSAGYPVAGFRPSTPFDLPLEPQQQAQAQAQQDVINDKNNKNEHNVRPRRPADTYGPPKPHDTYGPPHETYGPPAAWPTARVPFVRSNVVADDVNVAEQYDNGDYFEQDEEQAAPQFAAVADTTSDEEQSKEQQRLDVPFALLQLPVEYRPADTANLNNGY